MTESILQGYTAPVEKRCIRCGGIVDSELYALCDTCRTGDELAAWLEENCKKEADRREETDFARYGGI